MSYGLLEVLDAGGAHRTSHNQGNGGLQTLHVGDSNIKTGRRCHKGPNLSRDGTFSMAS